MTPAASLLRKLGRPARGAARSLALLAAVVLAAGLAGSAARAEEPVTLRVFSATDTVAVTELLARFEASHPQIRVDYVEFNTSELHRAIAGGAEGVDLVISSAMDLQAELVNSGRAFGVRPQVASVLPDWAQWRGELFGFTFEPIVMVYNRAAFADRALPRTRSELAGMIRDDPEFFRGRVGTYDIHLSGVGYLFATQDAQRGYQFSRLMESFGRADARVFCCTQDVLDRVASGELVYGYNMIGSYALGRVREDPRLGLYLLDDYTLVMTRTAFIPKTAPNKAAAVTFLEFLLSREGQEAIAASPQMVPLMPPDRSSALTAVDPPLADGGADGGLQQQGRSLLPIRLGIGLLAYLDALKKEAFLADWRAAVQPPGQSSE